MAHTFQSEERECSTLDCPNTARCDDHCIPCTVQKYLTGGEDLKQDIELFPACDWFRAGSAWNAVRERVLAHRALMASSEMRGIQIPEVA